MPDCLPADSGAAAAGMLDAALQTPGSLPERLCCMLFRGQPASAGCTAHHLRSGRVPVRVKFQSFRRTRQDAKQEPSAYSAVRLSSAIYAQWAKPWHERHALCQRTNCKPTDVSTRASYPPTLPHQSPARIRNINHALALLMLRLKIEALQRSTAQVENAVVTIVQALIPQASSLEMR